jgi:hypothetical protein
MHRAQKSGLVNLAYGAHLSSTSPWRTVPSPKSRMLVSGSVFGIQEERLREEEKVPSSAYRSILSRMIGAWNAKQMMSQQAHHDSAAWANVPSKVTPYLDERTCKLRDRKKAYCPVQYSTEDCPELLTTVEAVGLKLVVTMTDENLMNRYSVMMPDKMQGIDSV